MILSFEDDETELRRRVRAAMIHYRIDPKDIAGWLYLAAPGRFGWKLAGLDDKGGFLEGELLDYLADAIRALSIEAVILDPFVKTHALPENDNNNIDRLATLLATFAHELDISIDLPHHVSKGGGDPGNPDKSRGASALAAAVRLVYSLTPMTEDEAEQCGVLPDARRAYVRLDPAKTNIAPSAYGAVWFQIIGVDLGNGTADYPHGDNVQTVEPWKPTSVFDGVSVSLANAILDKLDAGNWSAYAGAKERAAWQVVRELTGKEEAACKIVIKTWVDNGVLVSEAFKDGGKGRSAMRVRVVKRPGPNSG
jgi:hypothetical protein